MKSCFTCIFNNEVEDKCDKDKQYFYSEFGKNCLDYKEKIKEVINE